MTHSLVTTLLVVSAYVATGDRLKRTGVHAGDVNVHEETRAQTPAEGAGSSMPVPATASMEALATAWFTKANGSPKSVSKNMMEDMTSDALKSDECGVVQVIKNTVYVQKKELAKAFYNGRLRDTVSLLHLATKSGRLPDVDMVVCCGDSGALSLKTSKFVKKVPVLATYDRPREQRVAAIPVPMIARTSQGFWFDKEAQDLRSGKLFPPVAWKKKLAKAVFRGSSHSGMPQWEPTSNPYGQYGPGFRKYIVEKLTKYPNFDVKLDSHMPEEHFEDYMIELIVGNNGGWADRLTRTMFKSSVSLFLDQQVNEWFMPLLKDEDNYLVTEPNVAAVMSKTKKALRNQTALKEIVARQNRFAKETFSEKSLVRYMSQVVAEYAKTLAYSPTRRKDMQAASEVVPLEVRQAQGLAVLEASKIM